MPFCPKCRCEYENDVQICADCEVDLVAELPPEIPEEYSEAEWVELCTFPGTLYARMAVDLLNKEGISAYSQSFFGGAALAVADAGDFVGATASVFVLEPDLDRSRELVEPMIDEIPNGMDEDGDGEDDQ